MLSTLPLMCACVCMDGGITIEQLLLHTTFCDVTHTKYRVKYWVPYTLSFNPYSLAHTHTELVS